MDPWFRILMIRYVLVQNFWSIRGFNEWEIRKTGWWKLKANQLRKRIFKKSEFLVMSSMCYFFLKFFSIRILSANEKTDFTSATDSNVERGFFSGVSNSRLWLVRFFRSWLEPCWRDFSILLNVSDSWPSVDDWSLAKRKYYQSSVVLDRSKRSLDNWAHDFFGKKLYSLKMYLKWLQYRKEYFVNRFDMDHIIWLLVLNEN